MNNNSIVSGDQGSDVLMFSSTIATAGVYGGTGGDTITFTGAVSGATVDFGADNDLATFSGAISGGSKIYGGAGADTLHFDNIAVTATSLTGGNGGDLFSGGISVGSSGVSFWGGAGADTFNFSNGITNDAGTAYFWNADAGTDSINLSGATMESLRTSVLVYPQVVVSLLTSALRATASRLIPPTVYLHRYCNWRTCYLLVHHYFNHLH